jgi:hypothetical protein
LTKMLLINGLQAGKNCECQVDGVVIVGSGNRPDSQFNESKITNMLDLVEKNIHDAPVRTQSAMNNFVSTVAVSYLPLHEKAVETAKAIGPIEIKREKKKNSILHATQDIQKIVERGKIGFKRKYVRC